MEIKPLLLPMFCGVSHSGNQRPEALGLRSRWRGLAMYIPDKDQVTGLAINYNQPDAEAPNLLLLTCQPSIIEWSSESLLAFVNEAFDLSHIRKVNTDMVKQDPGLSTFLPAIANDYLPNVINRDSSHPRELDYTWVNKPRT